MVRASATRWRLPAPVYRTVAVAHGSQIYLFGGHDPAGDTIDTVDGLDSLTGATRIAGRLAVPSHGAAAAALAGQLLIFGGASTTVHDLIQRFDPARHAARVVGQLPGLRADVTAAVVGHTLLLIGGFDGSGPQSAVWASRDGRHFRTIARLPQAVRYAAVIADRNSAYVFGGLISGGEYDGRFSNLIQRIRIGPHPTAAIVARLPTPLAHAMGALIDGRLLVLGGSTPHGPSSAILRFDPSHRRVVHAGRLPHPLTDAAVATIANTAYLLGGISTGPLARVIEVRLVPANRPSSRRPHQASPPPVGSPASVFWQDPYMGVACPTANSIACDSRWPVGVAAPPRGRHRHDRRSSTETRRPPLELCRALSPPDGVRVRGLPATSRLDDPLARSPEPGHLELVWQQRSLVPSPVRIHYRNGKTAITQQHVPLSAGWG